MEAKVCKICGIEKPLTEFTKNAGHKDGRGSYCVPCHRADLRAHYDSERSRSRAKAWRQQNNERFRASVEEWTQAHPGYHRTFRHEHREMYRAFNHASRARAQGAEGTFTPEEWTALCEQYGNVCLACGSTGPLTVDHVIPLSKGGPNTIDNIQPLCGSCNSRKKDNTIDYRIFGVGTDRLS